MNQISPHVQMIAPVYPKEPVMNQLEPVTVYMDIQETIVQVKLSSHSHE